MVNIQQSQEIGKNDGKVRPAKEAPNKNVCEDKSKISVACE